MTEVKEENEQRRRDKHIKEGSEIKRWKGKETKHPLAFSHKTILKRWQPIRFLLSPHTTSGALSCLFNLSSSTFCLRLHSNSLSVLTSPALNLPPFSHHINDREDDTEAHHLYLSLRLRPPEIRNSPLIWNKWPSSGKPKPPDSAAWFIKGAWSRKLVQPQQKAKALSTCYTKLKVRS